MCNQNLINIYLAVSANPRRSKRGCFACPWLENVEMYMYAKCDDKIYHVVRVVKEL